jgi:hypothetical protein
LNPDELPLSQIEKIRVVAAVIWTALPAMLLMDLAPSDRRFALFLQEEAHRYNDGFETPSTFRWQSQNRTAMDSPAGRRIEALDFLTSLKEGDSHGSRHRFPASTGG